jgi:hypothetical protein
MRRGHVGWFGPFTGWSLTDPMSTDWLGDDITCRSCPRPKAKPLYRIMAAWTPVEARCVECGRLVLGYRIVSSVR